MAKSEAPPAFTIGHVAVHGKVILAPMSGYSDLPFRTICRRLGSAMSYTSCISDDAVIHDSAHVSSCRFATTATLARFLPWERPVAIQILGQDESLLVEAGLRLMELEPDLVDLNLGCPARRVCSGGRGAALLRDPAKIGRLVSRLVQVLPVPVTAKIRLGWDNQTRNYMDVARVLEDSGASAIGVHGRTRQQGYAGQADWQAIAEVKQAVGVPVLGNGDVRTVADIEAIQATTGCDGVLIGRAAIGNPWIFERRDLCDVPYEERLAMIRRHLAAMVDCYGQRHGLLRFRKHVVKYVRGLDGGPALRSKLVASETPEDLLRVLESWSPSTQTHRRCHRP